MSSVPDQTPYGLSMGEISRGIGMARIVLIIGLVFLHYGTFPTTPQTPFHGLDTQNHQFATWLNSTILFFFFSAVPLLSMISGWLYFSFRTDTAWDSLGERIRKRFLSLYLPLLLWNGAYFIGFFALYQVKPDAAFFGPNNRLGVDFHAGHWLDLLNAVTGITETPIAFQFWFLRDLFVTVLVSPFLWLLLSRCAVLGAVLIGAAWLYGWDMVIFTRPDVPFFFYLGAMLRLKNVQLTVPLKLTLGLLALYIVLAGIRALAPYITEFPGGENPYWLDLVVRPMRLIGVVACWGVIYRLARTGLGARIAMLGGVSFFLYAAHWPLLGIVKAGLWKFSPGESDGWMLVHYVLSVAITATICIVGALLLAKFLPRVFAFMNGGRLLGQTK